jgi:Fic family protein
MAEKKLEKTTSVDLKQLRQDRKEYIDRARDAMKEQNKVIKALREALAEKRLTIPELATAVGMKTDTVLMYISTLKKYGIVGEGPKNGDYFTYELLPL